MGLEPTCTCTCTCAVLLCLVCLFDLACFFLSSFSSLIQNMYIHVHVYVTCSGKKVPFCANIDFELCMNNHPPTPQSPPAGRGDLHSQSGGDWVSTRRWSGREDDPHRAGRALLLPARDRSYRVKPCLWPPRQVPLLTVSLLFTSTIQPGAHLFELHRGCSL